MQFRGCTAPVPRWSRSRREGALEGFMPPRLPPTPDLLLGDLGLTGSSGCFQLRTGSPHKRGAGSRGPDWVPRDLQLWGWGGHEGRPEGVPRGRGEGAGPPAPVWSSPFDDVIVVSLVHSWQRVAGAEDLALGLPQPGKRHSLLPLILGLWAGQALSCWGCEGHECSGRAGLLSDPPSQEGGGQVLSRTSVRCSTGSLAQPSAPSKRCDSAGVLGVPGGNPDARPSPGERPGRRGGDAGSPATEHPGHREALPGRELGQRPGIHLALRPAHPSPLCCRDVTKCSWRGQAMIEGEAVRTEPALLGRMALLPAAGHHWTGLSAHLAGAEATCGHLSRPLFTPSRADPTLGLVVCWATTLPAPGTLRGLPGCLVWRPQGQGAGERRGGRDLAPACTCTCCIFSISTLGPPAWGRGAQRASVVCPGPHGRICFLFFFFTWQDLNQVCRPGSWPLSKTRQYCRLLKIVIPAGHPRGPSSHLGLCPWP